MKRFQLSFRPLSFGFLLFLSFLLVGCAAPPSQVGGAFGGTPNPESASTTTPGSIGKPSGQPGSPPRKTDSQRAVTIEVDWVAGWEIGKQEPIRFQVVMDTHSVDLDRYNMMELAVLRTSNGYEQRPEAWDAPKGGGHHRSGVLRFSPTDAAGRPVITEDIKAIELSVREVAEVSERLFRWELAK